MQKLVVSVLLAVLLVGVTGCSTSEGSRVEASSTSAPASDLLDPLEELSSAQETQVYKVLVGLDPRFKDSVKAGLTACTHNTKAFSCRTQHESSIDPKYYTVQLSESYKVLYPS